MMLNQEMEVARIVLDHPQCAKVLQRHRIDYCCHGRRSLAEACEGLGLDPARVLPELEQAIADRGDGDAVDARQLPTGELVDHLVHRHHAYLRETLPSVRPLAEKVARVHGAHEPRLHDVRDAVERFSELMLPHMDHEEQVLFPALAGGQAPPKGVTKELSDMHTDHLAVAEVISKLREASDDFTVPEWGCASYKALYRELDALIADTFEHVHLENHVLAPRFTRA